MLTPPRRFFRILIIYFFSHLEIFSMTPICDLHPSCLNHWRLHVAGSLACAGFFRELFLSFRIRSEQPKRCRPSCPPRYPKETNVLRVRPLLPPPASLPPSLFVQFFISPSSRTAPPAKKTIAFSVVLSPKTKLRFLEGATIESSFRFARIARHLPPAEPSPTFKHCLFHLGDDGRNGDLFAAALPGLIPEHRRQTCVGHSHFFWSPLTVVLLFL